jgi:hypothetical protein
MRRTAIALALAAILALSALGLANAIPASTTNQHFYATTHTNSGGFASIDLQTNVVPANVVVKVASGATNLGGEDPSFATANFAGFVDENTIRVRVIGWKATPSTGNAIFRYYADKDITLAVDVYERTTVPVPVP